MTHPIIKTENYLLVVDELSDVKDENIGDVFKETKDGVTKTYKIIAHLPLNNAPTLEGVPLLPPLDEAEHLVIPNIYFQSFDEFGEPKWDESKLYHRQQGFIEGYKKGYKKAKEDFKYTEEDLKIAINMARNFPYIKKGEVKFDTPIEKIIQSIQQPKYPVAFESAMGTIDDGFLTVDVPKTITNSQGLTQLVGKYIY
jgi:hypothetical protein